MQTRSFEDAAGEGQAYAASRKVASELRGMLEGSAQINARKGGAGAPACITCVPQVCSTGFHNPFRLGLQGVFPTVIPDSCCGHKVATTQKADS